MAYTAVAVVLGLGFAARVVLHHRHLRRMDELAARLRALEVQETVTRA